MPESDKEDAKGLLQTKSAGNDPDLAKRQKQAGVNLVHMGMWSVVDRVLRGRVILWVLCVLPIVVYFFGPGKDEGINRWINLVIVSYFVYSRRNEIGDELNEFAEVYPEKPSALEKLVTLPEYFQFYKGVREESRMNSKRDTIRSMIGAYAMLFLCLGVYNAAAIAIWYSIHDLNSLLRG